MTSGGFDPASLAALDEPVRRYLAHAISAGAPLPGGMRLRMTGRIRVGRWLSFSADQEIGGRSFVWHARAGRGALRPLHVIDRYRDGTASMDGRLWGRLRFLHSDDENTLRAAAARVAAESIWSPADLLPERGVSWRAVDDEMIVARLHVPPERPEVTLRIDASGALRTVKVIRWGDAGGHSFLYIPFGGTVLAEHHFGDFTLPSRLSVGWWFETPRYAPSFEATLLDARPLELAAGNPAASDT